MAWGPYESEWQGDSCSFSERVFLGKVVMSLWLLGDSCFPSLKTGFPTASIQAPAFQIVKRSVGPQAVTHG